MHQIEMVQFEPSHQDLYCKPFLMYLIKHVKIMNPSNYNSERILWDTLKSLKHVYSIRTPCSHILRPYPESLLECPRIVSVFSNSPRAPGKHHYNQIQGKWGYPTNNVSENLRFILHYFKPFPSPDDIFKSNTCILLRTSSRPRK